MAAISTKSLWAILAALIVLVSIDPVVFSSLAVPLTLCWCISQHSTFVQELRLLVDDLPMEQQASHLLPIVKNNNIPLDTKLSLLGKLKAHIKHHQVPEAAVAPAFDVVRAALSSSHCVDAGFSTLSHLTKRLILQEQIPILASQGTKIYPSLLERLSDHKDRVRQRAIQALSDFWVSSTVEVEQVIRDAALSGKSPRAKEAGMQWIIKV